MPLDDTVEPRAWVRVRRRGDWGERGQPAFRSGVTVIDAGPDRAPAPGRRAPGR